jgi:SAM-dependent methyltransferase
MKNNIASLLYQLGICDPDSTVPFFPKVRDRDDVSVIKCNKSGVLFLSRSDHLKISHYNGMSGFNYWAAEGDRKEAVVSCLEDNKRRYTQFSSIIANKIWLDIGTGAGGLLDLLSPIASRTLAVEPQNTARKWLIDNGYEVYANIAEVPMNHIDVVTLFHVFEHFIDPLDTLKLVRGKMKSGGKLVIEVPHANDFLISF